MSADKETVSFEDDLDSFLRRAGFAWELEERFAIHNAVAKWLRTYDGAGTDVVELAEILEKFTEGW